MHHIKIDDTSDEDMIAEASDKDFLDYAFR